MYLKINNKSLYTNGTSFGIIGISHTTECGPPNMKKKKSLVTIFAFAFHLALLFWAFQQMN